jgi:hypothetical protein
MLVIQALLARKVPKVKLVRRALKALRVK